MTPSQKLVAEALGTAFLTAVVFGSAAMGAALTPDAGLGLLVSSLVTGFALFVLITIFAPISGAHFNPAVTLVFLTRREIGAGEAGAFLLAQAAGALAGAIATHLMFGMAWLEWSGIVRDAPRLWLSEGIATFGLVLVILGGIAAKGPVPALVGAYIAAGYWFTSSTSFANPAMSLARTMTGTGAGIRLEDVTPYLVVQIAGALVAAMLGRWLFAGDARR
ncbi:MAG TPA: aquaporin [Tabrizicola sp.]|nr:aquaporin [Tabrizicola sp.]